MNYENMTKEELIAEIKRLEVNNKDLKTIDDLLVAEVERLKCLVKSIQFLLEHSYNDIRNN